MTNTHIDEYRKIDASALSRRELRIYHDSIGTPAFYLSRCRASMRARFAGLERKMFGVQQPAYTLPFSMDAYMREYRHEMS